MSRPIGAYGTSALHLYSTSISGGDAVLQLPTSGSVSTGITYTLPSGNPPGSVPGVLLNDGVGGLSWQIDSAAQIQLGSLTNTYTTFISISDGTYTLNSANLVLNASGQATNHLSAVDVAAGSGAFSTNFFSIYQNSNNGTAPCFNISTVPDQTSDATGTITIGDLNTHIIWNSFAADAAKYTASAVLGLNLNNSGGAGNNYVTTIVLDANTNAGSTVVYRASNSSVTLGPLTVTSNYTQTGGAFSMSGSGNFTVDTTGAISLTAAGGFAASSMTITDLTIGSGGYIVLPTNASIYGAGNTAVSFPYGLTTGSGSSLTIGGSLLGTSGSSLGTSAHPWGAFYSASISDPGNNTTVTIGGSNPGTFVLYLTNYEEGSYVQLSLMPGSSSLPSIIVSAYNSMTIAPSSNYSSGILYLGGASIQPAGGTGISLGVNGNAWSGFYTASISDNGSSVEFSTPITFPNANIQMGTSALPLGTLYVQNPNITDGNGTTGYFSLNYNIPLDTSENNFTIAASNDTLIFQLYCTNTASPTDANQFLTWLGNTAYKTAGTAWTVLTSDKKLKQDIVEYGHGLDVISQVKIYSFRLKKEIATDGDKAKRHVGIIAQEIQQLLPNTVHYSARHDVLAFDIDELQYATINAVKQLAIRVEDLEKKLEKFT